ncbi:hypothetical protein PtA15_14A96 [Puccinia triticina]|uniref:PX domain-containing protein n=1 Tax=Puccinia triticina TaxID=208348 RepID=A0ABY7D2W4_9BASI|nr:uncharacterized protein PtA15_14A96 [Puccinia triticina]WAQ91215.1 hypothetical protein PtA15_14A96 [Puccinia triticina]
MGVFAVFKTFILILNSPNVSKSPRLQTGVISDHEPLGLYKEIQEFKEDAEKVAVKIADDRLCERIKKFVEAPREIQELCEEDAKSENVNLMAVILRSPEGPKLDKAAYQRIQQASQAYEQYKTYRDRLDDPALDEVVVPQVIDVSVTSGHHIGKQNPVASTSIVKSAGDGRTIKANGKRKANEPKLQETDEETDSESDQSQSDQSPDEAPPPAKKGQGRPRKAIIKDAARRLKDM